MASDAQQQSGMKTCPMCAEPIREQAVVCRFCGSSFASAPSPPTPYPDARPTLGVSVAALVVGIVGMMFWAVALSVLVEAVDYPGQGDMFAWTEWSIISLTPPVLAIIFGRQAVLAIRRSPPGAWRGIGMAWAGIILGIVAGVLIATASVAGYINRF